MFSQMLSELKALRQQSEMTVKVVTDQGLQIQNLAVNKRGHNVVSCEDDLEIDPAPKRQNSLEAIVRFSDAAETWAEQNRQEDGEEDDELEDVPNEEEKMVEERKIDEQNLSLGAGLINRK